MSVRPKGQWTRFPGLRYCVTMARDPLIGFTSEGLRFDRLLGRGGMGAVYAGWQLRLDRMVAIKVIAGHLALDAEYAARFAREARCLGRLHHEHITACYDHGPITGPGGDPLLVMVLEHVAGGTLSERLRQPATVQEVLTWFAQAADGLAFAHGQGVLHRDIKPDNLMLTEEGRLKLADFGLARAGDSDQVTATGAVLGSPAYMAPEACRGEEPTPVADLYSLGCSLFQALTGQPPYPGSGILQVLQAHQRQPVPNLGDHRPDLPLLVPILARCLAKRPEDRYPSVAAFAAELRRIQPLISATAEAGRARRSPGGARAAATVIGDDGEETARTATLATRVAPSPRRWPWWGAGLAGLVTVAAVAAWTWRTPSAAPMQDEGHRDQAENINALLDKAELLLAEHRGAAATAALDTLPLWVRTEDLTSAQRARLQALQARLEQGEGISTGESQISERLDRAERHLTTGDIPGAIDLLAALHVPARLTSQEDRRLALLGKAQALVVAADTTASVTILEPRGGVAARLGELPLGAPWTDKPIVGFPLEGGVHRLRVPVTAGGTVLVMLGSDELQQVSIHLRSGGIEKRAMTITVDGWTTHALAIPDGAVESLIFEAGSPIALAAAIQGKTPTVADLPMVPGTLREFRPPVVPPRLDGLRLLWPEALVPADLGQIVAKGLGLGDAVPVMGYSLRDRDLGVQLRGLMGESSAILVGVPTILAPGERFQELVKRMRESIVVGTYPILVLGVEHGVTAKIGVTQRPTWQRNLENGRERSPAIIDLSQVSAFYERHQQPWDARAPAASQAVLRGLEIGLRQLADKLALGRSRQASTLPKGGGR